MTCLASLSPSCPAIRGFAGPVTARHCDPREGPNKSQPQMVTAWVAPRAPLLPGATQRAQRASHDLPGPRGLSGSRLPRAPGPPP
eukprot:9494482-Pyramimonas_sp.AAC.1